ncbi:ABC transporter permease [Saccharomonospora viridis]|uniref:ABC transporter permease n=1 Tax=Saccharomonospora viridis TaxID=1852 RepID=UPI0024A8F38B|nr:ABC transporter permease [Saccharomonospora viridis]
MTGDDARTPADSGTLRSPKSTGEPSETTPTAGNLSGTGQLIRLALRRDRLVLPLWIVVVVLLTTAGAGAYEQLYPDPAERAALTAGMANNPSITLLLGPAYDLSTAGGFTAWRFGTMLSLLLALVCVFTMTRHTRQEEETGRYELLSSTVVGRYAFLAASSVVCAAFAALTGLATASALIAAGTSASGAFAFGLGLTSVAWVFTGVAAVTAQLAEYSRAANGLAGAVLGIAFAVRAVGDSSAEVSWLSWLSPLGWATRVRPFAGDRFWVLLIPVVVTAALAVTAYLLQRRRDVGFGLLPTPLGPATAAPRLRTPFALAVRLHRGTLLGWVAGFAVLSVLFGWLASDIGDIVGDNERMRDMLAELGGGRGMVDAYLAATADIFGMVAALFVVQATVRIRTEETALRAEPLLTTGVSRLRWVTGHLVLVFAGGAALLLAAGLGMGFAHGVRVGDVGAQTPDVLLACLSQIPAVFVVGGVAVVLFGLLPAHTVGAWAVAAAFLLLSLFGPVLQLDQAVLNASPFQHVPQLPSEDFTAAPMLWLTLVAAGLVTAGVVGFRRRDLG